jgi:soluble lytic murein transglycosylase-like protein
MRQLAASGPAGRQQAIWLAGQTGVGNLSNLLLSQDLDQKLQAAAKLAGATQESVAAAQRLQKEWADLQQRFTVVGEHIFAKLEPVLEKLGMRLANWLDKIDWNKVLNQLSAFADRVNGIVQDMGGWKVVAEIVAGLIGLKLVASIGSAISLLTTLGGIIPGLTSNFTLLAAAIAAAGGAWVGSHIYHDLMENNATGRGTGSLVAQALSGLGNDTAFTAQQQSFWAERSATQRKQMASIYNVMSASEKADYDKRNPELARLIKQQLSQEQHKPSVAMNASAGAMMLPPGTGEPFASTRSRAFGTPEALAAALEAKTGVSAKVLLNTFKTESNRGLNLYSKAGALGPMQLMPATAKEQGLNRDSVRDLDYSMTAAARIWQGNLARFHGNYALAAAAYNAGGGNVHKYGGVPPFAETQDYVKKVLQGVAVGPAATAMTGARPGTGMIDRSVEVNIASMQVNAPKATDAQGIAQNMQTAMRQNSLIASATSGVE